MVPAGAGASKALPAQVMEDDGLAGMASFVSRAREYVRAIVPENGILRAETMRLADEIQSPDHVGLPKPVKAKRTDAKKIIASMKRLTRTSLDKRELVDCGAERLEPLARRKGKPGKDVLEVQLSGEEEQGNVIDLMERLKERLEASQPCGTSRDDLLTNWR